MNPVDHPEAFDTVRIAGVPTPGVATISGLSLEMGWDVQDASGSSGASLARKGRKLSKFTIQLHLVRDVGAGIDQFAEWYDSFLPMLRSCFDGKQSVGLDCEHPDLQALDINSVVIEKIGQLQHDGTGGATVDIACIQFAPPKKVSTAGPSKSKGSEGADWLSNPAIDSQVDTITQLWNGP